MDTEAAKMLGRRGGLKGGPARAKSLSSEARSMIARKAAVARWGVSGDEHEQGETICAIMIDDLFRLKEKILRMQGQEEVREALLKLIEKGALHFGIERGEPTYMRPDKPKESEIPAAPKNESGE
jgi:hypothetical protein